MEKEIKITEESVISKIYSIRDKKVMIDKDLAELYGVETKYLKRQVKRNIKRFPEDFMFEMSKEEFQHWRSQFVTSNSSEKMGLRYAPYVFTEQGVAMLSGVLHSDRAIMVNIQIMRAYSQMQELLTNNLNFKIEIEEIKKKLSNHSKNIELVFNYLDELIDKKENQKPRTRIGYNKGSN